MKIANSLSFIVFGIIMRLLPVVAPALVAPDAAGIADAEATTRGIWLVVMGYSFGAIGAWFFMQEITRRAALALAHRVRHIRATRETRALARAREARVRALTRRVTVRVQF